VRIYFGRESTGRKEALGQKIQTEQPTQNLRRKGRKA
tara:strand:+ start:890 stop:1000 length:111 start_codon:yes stop_codon:yes gene_type:complete